MEREVEAAAGCGVTGARGGGQYGADSASPGADINAIMDVFVQ